MWTRWVQFDQAYPCLPAAELSAISIANAVQTPCCPALHSPALFSCCCHLQPVWVKYTDGTTDMTGWSKSTVTGTNTRGLDVTTLQVNSLTFSSAGSQSADVTVKWTLDRNPTVFVNAGPSTDSITIIARPVPTVTVEWQYETAYVDEVGSV